MRWRRRANRHLVDALTRGQRVQLAGLILAWVGLSVWAWRWWLDPSHASTPVALIVNTALLSVEALILPVWFFVWIWRMKRPDPRLTPPDLRTAIVVTKAPSEPWPLVRETLEAMLEQDFPHPYDVWLADEDPTEATLAWCAEHGVRVSCRRGVAEYHRATWPRRTRCKEGNLAYFYDHWGYDLYDVVAQLDADHVPAPDYLTRIVIPFRDPMVGYVAAPSICDRNAARSWSARGRLYAEALLHGPTQAGHSGGFAPSCIGSHYAVRTEALREIGGLGPELAEDFTTTLMMSAWSWQGVFAVEAEAHGDGPETFADCMTQEFQWSRSMVNVLLGVGRSYRRSVGWPARIRLSFCLWWYPLFGALMLASVLIPITAIATRTPFVRMPLGAFYAHFGPPTLVLLGCVVWLRALHWLRPRTARPVSWEMALFQIVRWPWALFGCLHAVAGRVAGREFAFKVTPKGREGVAPLPMRVLLPYLLLALMSAAPALLNLDAGAAHGYYLLAMINVVLYAGAAVAIVGLHIYEHPRSLRLDAIRGALVKVGVTAATGVASVTALITPGVILPPPMTAEALPAAMIDGAGTGTPGRGGVPAVTDVPALTVGVTTFPLAANSFRRWSARSLSTVGSFERAAGVHAGIVMWYADWAHSRPDLAQLRLIAARGSTPEISWEPWSYDGSARHQPRFSLASIIAGRHDAYIRAWAQTLKRFGRPVLLRFAQEFNGDWYPWSERVNGNHTGQFAAAWRHVHDVFTALGAGNVRWVWSPSAGSLAITREQYPGTRYVDIVGLSVFNGGTALPWGGWRSFARIYDPSEAALAQIAPGKPIQVSETGSAERGGNKGAWIAAMFAHLRHRPEVTSLIWYDVPKQADWPITSSARAIRAFRRGARVR